MAKILTGALGIRDICKVNKNKENLSLTTRYSSKLFGTYYCSQKLYMKTLKECFYMYIVLHYEIVQKNFRDIFEPKKHFQNILKNNQKRMETEKRILSYDHEY